jgi:ATP-dependent Clp protease ATP-binding subunit ClpA
MSFALEETFFSQHGRQITPPDLQQGVTFPFQQHTLFPYLADILSRAHQHHVHLVTSFAPATNEIFLRAFLHHLNQSGPTALQKAEWWWLDIEHTLFTDLKQPAIEKDFEALLQQLEQSEQYLFVILTRADCFSESKRHDERFLRKQMQRLSIHPRCRVLLITPTTEVIPEHQFTSVWCPALSEEDRLALLKTQGATLAQHYQLTLPDAVLTTTLALAARYLSTTEPLQKALLLLDSSLARKRGSTTTSTQTTTLCMADILGVLSDWTAIPAAQLIPHPAKQAEWLQGLSQEVVGQEIAVSALREGLSQARLLTHRTRPLGCFLFAGPAYVGKKRMALSLAKQWFGQYRPLYFAQPLTASTDIMHIPLQCYHDHSITPLADVIRHKPYAILYFEQCDTLTAPLRDALQAICRMGYGQDAGGGVYDFRQAVLIFSLTLTTTDVATYHQPTHADQAVADLMTLVMNPARSNEKTQEHYYRLIEKMRPLLSTYLPEAFCRELTLIPFTPLDQLATEKWIRLKLKKLGKQLHIHHDIELGYAPEIIRYLAYLLTRPTPASTPLNPEIALEPLYVAIEEALFHHMETPRQSNQLFIQLNETGTAILCDWLPMEEVSEA